MDDQQEKKQWGGKRAGSGRKRTCAKRIGFNATQDVADILKDVPNITEYINNAIIYFDNSNK